MEVEDFLADFEIVEEEGIAADFVPFAFGVALEGDDAGGVLFF